MINSVPLIQNVAKDDINTSIIALKKEEKRLEQLIAEADAKIAELNELKVSKSDIVDEVTLNNMQSVTSNAVAQALYNVETYTAISGLTLYKIGRIVFGLLIKDFSGSSPITVGVLPAKWRPIQDCRVCFMNNASDTPKGQFIVYNVDGDIRLYQESGGSLSYTVAVSFTYFTET